MAQRPEILWPLFGELTSLDGVGPKLAGLFEKIGVLRPADLLLHAPHGVIDRRARPSVRGAAEGEVVTVEVEIGAHHPPRGGGKAYRIEARDAEESFLLVFFNPKGDWLQRKAPIGSRRIVSGRVEIFDGVRTLPHPDHLLAPEEAASLPPFEPVYPATQGLGQRIIARAAASALARAPDLPEWIEPSLLSRRGWPGWRAAAATLHAPEGAAALAAEAPARARLAYDELLSHQLTLALARARMKRGKGRASVGDGRLRAKVAEALPFPLTGAQARAIAEIEADLAAPERMNRLLQGDVGAGKTVVALMAMLIAIEAGGQAALMAPTEVLARQHRRGLQALAEAAGVRLMLLTGRDKGEGRDAKLAALAGGDVDVVIGTHALFSKDVAFRDLRLAVVDEQHRFGVRQRMDLAAKGRGADVLVMTATPIPRTLALAGYGDMDVSALDEKPPGRQPVETRLVSLSRVSEVVERLRLALDAGARAFWVCPLVEESEDSDLTAAEARFAELRRALGRRVTLVHGQMGSADKDRAMEDFKTGRAQLLVATTVIEVGVDVPEATIIVIEGAESFGLAQLHQLRGRVGRGAAASTCLLLYGALGDIAKARLQALRDTEDGFRIAEEDLRIRGPGDLLGAQQSGAPRFRLADMERQLELMRAAQADARLALARDPTLESERGRALRTLLWLHERDAAIRYLKAG